MIKFRAASAAAGLLALALGVFGGEALAVPFFAPGGQFAHPIARTALTTYSLPMAFMPGDTITYIEVGRDDATPYASFLLQFKPGAPNLIPPYNVFGNGGAYSFTYRPYWDSALYPTLTTAAGAPIGGRMDGQWRAIDKFVSDLEQIRAYGATPPATFPNPMGVFWIDYTQVGGGNIYDTEFYKYWTRY